MRAPARLDIGCYVFFFFFNQAAENPIISNNPITFPSDSAAQIQGWICGLARFTDRLLKRGSNNVEFPGRLRSSGIWSQRVTRSLRGGIMTEREREEEESGLWTVDHS